jgi:hypothetical protein
MSVPANVDEPSCPKATARAYVIDYVLGRPVMRVTHIGPGIEGHLPDFSHPFFHGLSFGITLVTSTSRNMPPAITPSRTQRSAAHQSS